MLICRNCGNSGRDMFGNVCPCRKHRMKGQAMYAVFYRLGGDEDTWRQAPMRYVPGEHITAMHTADAIQATLRHAGHQSAQAEVREVYMIPSVSGHDIAVGADGMALPVVEVGHGETPPERITQFYRANPAATWVKTSAYDGHVTYTCAKCVKPATAIFHSGEGVTSWYCVDHAPYKMGR